MASCDEEESLEETNSMFKRPQRLPLTALRNQEYEKLYPSVEEFNDVQTEVFTALYNTDDNVLVAAPRGSGKTICAEFAIFRNLQKRTDSTVRVVCIAHVDPISKERYHRWQEMFGEGLQLLVVELTGDTAVDLKRLEESQIIITTPERWDALSRHWKQRKFVQQVSLFLIDDLHLIHSNAGPVLETIVARMKYISSDVGNKMRIVALSTSVSNPEELGEWIGASSCGLFSFPLVVRHQHLDLQFRDVDIYNTEELGKLTCALIIEHARKPAIVYALTTRRIRDTALTLAYSSSITGDGPFLLKTDDLFQFCVSEVSDKFLRTTLLQGVAFLHEGLSRHDQELVKTVFKGGWIQVCVMTSSLCWGMPLTAHLVIVMGTDYYYNLGESAYSVIHMQQMIGQAIEYYGKCVILCHGTHIEYYRKYLYEECAVESKLEDLLHDNFNAEIAAGLIKNKQDAVHYFCRTFMYQRLRGNPDYHDHQKDHLLKLINSTFSDLETSKCVVIEDDYFVCPTRLGMVASYYYISYTTIQHFRSSLSSETTMEGLLMLLASAPEYAQLPVRYWEEEQVIMELIRHQKFSLQNPRYGDPHLKANALLQAHLSRNHLGGSLVLDLKEVLLSASRLLRAMVYVISNNGWLSLALLAMELSQMVTQGMWRSDSMLLQLPHFSKELAKRCHEKSIRTILDLVKMKADERRELLQMDGEQLLDVEKFSHHFPNIDLSYLVMLVNDGEDVLLLVMLEMGMEGRWSEVDAPGCPKTKEGWWLVVGDTESNQLLAIKGVSLQRKANVQLQFPAPAKGVRNKAYTLYCKSDSHLGSDREYTFNVDFEEKFFIFCS